MRSMQNGAKLEQCQSGAAQTIHIRFTWIKWHLQWMVVTIKRTASIIYDERWTLSENVLDVLLQDIVTKSGNRFSQTAKAAGFGPIVTDKTQSYEA